MAMKEDKLSFSLASKSSSSSSSPLKRPPAFEETLSQAPNPSFSNPQFVTVFDPSQTRSLVIPAIPNSFLHATTKPTKNLSLPDTDKDLDSSQQQFVIEELDSNASDNISYGLTLRSNESDPKPQQQSEVVDLSLKRFREDMANLPDDRGMEEFKEVAVEDFAKAILAAYGWSEGEGIGKNNKWDTKVVQYNKRYGTHGLGYEPKVGDSVVKVKKGREMVYVVNDKNVNGSKGLEPKIVRIVSGRHLGSKAEVLKRLDGSEVVLRLVGSGEEVRVDEEMVAELGSETEERCLKKLKDLENTEEKKEGSEKSPIRWLRSHIRVRIISKDFKGGKWYLKKGEVVDVVGPTTCDISIDGSGELVQGVDQEILESALPERGGSVVVLYGRNKGVYGSLVDRDMEEFTGVVRDTSSHDLINVRLEQIAEYVGDPSYLGY